MNSVSPDTHKLTLANLIIDCSFPCVCTFDKSSFDACHPFGSVWWIDGCHEGTFEDALADAAERRDGLVVIHADGQDYGESISPILCRWPKMRDKLKVYSLVVWTDVVRTLPWLGVYQMKGFVAAPVYPSVILLPVEGHARGALYLSSKMCTKEETLRDTNIGAIVNCAGQVCEEIGDARLVLDLVDDEEQSLGTAIEKAIPWVHDRIHRGLNVLVHCERGVSRSASIVVAYLVLRCGFNPLDALNHVSVCRSAANPNSNFRKQLLMLQP
jgi:hypothetical protein